MEHGVGCPCEKFSLGSEEIWLNSKVDLDSLRCFNEEKTGSVR